MQNGTRIRASCKVTVPEAAAAMSHTCMAS